MKDTKVKPDSGTSLRNAKEAIRKWQESQPWWADLTKDDLEAIVSLAEKANELNKASRLVIVGEGWHRTLRFGLTSEPDAQEGVLVCATSDQDPIERHTAERLGYARITRE